MAAEVLTAHNFQDFKTLKHGFFTSGWGNCGISDKFDAMQQDLNRNAVAYHLGLKNPQLLSTIQVHGTDVVTVTEPWTAKNRPTGDAMVTKLKKIGLGILTADCGPVLFVDWGAGVIGAAHAGWRGALKGIIKNTIEAMEALGANRDNIHGALGPCIGKMSYEVKHDLHSQFIAEDRANERFFTQNKTPDRFHFNLASYIEYKARDLSIASFSVQECDTYLEENRFFSFRRNTHKKIPKTESLISGIALM